MTPHGGAERATGVAVAVWPSQELGWSKTLLALQGSQLLRGWAGVDLNVGGELVSPVVVFAALGSPCAPSEGNLVPREEADKKFVDKLEVLAEKSPGLTLSSSGGDREKEEDGGRVMSRSQLPADMWRGYHNRECLVSRTHPPDPSDPSRLTNVDVEDRVCTLGGERTL